MMPIFKAVLSILAVLALGLQVSLWFSEASLPGLWRIDRQIALNQRDNQILIDRNQRVLNSILSLKERGAAIEDRARSDLGMIRPGETFYYFLDPDEDS